MRRQIECTKIAKKIIEAFTTNAPQMESYPTHHFALRVYRTTGEADKQKILANPIKEAEIVLKDITKAGSNRYVKIRSLELYDIMKDRMGKKERMRQKFFKTRKEDLFHYNLIQQLYFWRCLGIGNGMLKTYYNAGLSIIKDNKQHITKNMLCEDAIKYYGTQLANYAYFLKFFGICDITKKFRDAWQSIFMKTDNLSNYMFQNKIYGMTHFIIAGSDYYQTYASMQEFGWILEYFSNNINKIIKRTHIDIIAEVGLCYKLCNINNGHPLETIEDYVVKSFDRKAGFIPRKGYIPKSEERNLNIAEHTNAVSFMLLNGFKKLHGGPDLSGQFDDQFKK